MEREIVQIDEMFLQEHCGKLILRAQSDGTYIGMIAGYLPLTLSLWPLMCA
jgi:hypothetical protein